MALAMHTPCDGDKLFKTSILIIFQGGKKGFFECFTPPTVEILE